LVGARDEEMADNGSNNEGPLGNEDQDATGAGGKKDSGSSPDQRIAKPVEECSRPWVECTADVAVRVMAGASIGRPANTSESSSVGISRSAIGGDDGKGIGGAEAEALTVVLSSFLLDLYHLPEGGCCHCRRRIQRSEWLFLERKEHSGPSNF
jgi:hypothetical protein